jgi:hypothetical protein
MAEVLAVAVASGVVVTDFTGVDAGVAGCAVGLAAGSTIRCSSSSPQAESSTSAAPITSSAGRRSPRMHERYGPRAARVNVNRAASSAAPPSGGDAGKKKCVAQQASCLMSERGRDAKGGAAPDATKVAACNDKLDGGAKGLTRGCIGKLESKQNARKPKTACSVATDIGALEQAADALDPSASDGGGRLLPRY